MFWTTLYDFEYVVGLQRIERKENLREDSEVDYIFLMKNKKHSQKVFELKDFKLKKDEKINILKNNSSNSFNIENFQKIISDKKIQNNITKNLNNSNHKNFLTVNSKQKIKSQKQDFLIPNYKNKKIASFIYH